MQAYASGERPGSGGQVRPHETRPLGLMRPTAAMAGVDSAVVDGLIARLADFVADRVIERMATVTDASAGEWLDARDAADYLGLHRDTIRKLAAERTIPTHQDAPGCKLYFRRDELDDWRRMAPPKRMTRSLRAA